MAIVSDLSQHISLKQACDVLNVPRSRIYRARQPQVAAKPRPTPPNALTPEERATVRETLNSERFMDCTPRQVYATLLDEGTYLGHWRTMYRILAEHDEVRERRNLLRRPSYSKPELLATAPNQVWSWDITKLRGPRKWDHFALYTVLDIYSRYVVGWLIAEVECSELARQLIAESARKQGITPGQLTLHADNGSPMTSKTLGQLLMDLGIDKSHSRPHTSDDNPFSEAQFKTMKYCPSYPERFETLELARVWAREFYRWYNEQHYHSGLNLLTPSSVHYGEAEQVQQQRQTVLSAAYAANPLRFAQGEPVVKGAPAAVYINPPVGVANLS